MIAIVGETASGKTTLREKLIDYDKSYEKIITYATKPKLGSQKSAAEYNYIPEEVFNRLVDGSSFVRIGASDGWTYGFPVSSLKKEKGVAILTPAGLRALSKLKDFEIVSVYLMVDRRSRLIQSLCRGDEINQACWKNMIEIGEYDGIESDVDYVIDNTKYHMSEDETLKCLLQILEDDKE